MLKKEWKSLLKNPLLILVIVAIITIPTIYTTLFLGSMWDPYGKLDKLPVAVVNEDKEVLYEGKKLHIGKDLVEKLKEKRELDFHFTTKEDAEQGIKNGTYYMVITIPDNFSKNATSLTEDSPKKMELLYETNPGTNYIASKMSESAMEKMKHQVSEEVIKTYTETMFDNIVKVGDGLEEGADGANKIKDGLEKAKDGNATLSEKLNKLASSSLTLKSGNETLTQGLTQYIEGVSKVSDGTKELTSGVNKLSEKVSEGAKQLIEGEDTFSKGLTAYTDGVKQANAGALQLTEKSDDLVNGTKAVVDGVNSLHTGVSKVKSGLEVMSQKVDIPKEKQEQTKMLLEALPQINEAIQTLDQALQGTSEMNEQQLLATLATLKTKVHTLAQTSNQALPASVLAIQTYSGGLEAVKEGLTKEEGLIAGISQIEAGTSALKNGLNGETGLYTGIQAYTQGVSKVQAGLETLNEKSKELKQGNKQLKQGITKLQSGIETGANQLVVGSDKLQQGVSKLQENDQKLLDGVDKISDGITKISDGSKKLENGSEKVGDGLEELTDGAGTLSEKLTDGAKEIRDTKTDKKTVTMFSSPVEIKEEKRTVVENNGHAMAPYMMSVALWVGCIAFSLMYPLTKYSGELSSGISWWGSKASVLYTIAFLQGIVMIGCLHFFNGFSPVEMTKTLGFTLLASATFMSIMYFFTSTFGKVGSFLMLIFMVVQLAGSAGTYPVELSGDFVPSLNPFVPFTYTVKAFRSVIAGGESIQKECMVLLMWFVVFTALTIGTFVWKTRRIKQGKPLFEHWLEEKGLF